LIRDERWHRHCSSFININVKVTDMTQKQHSENQGEGNREADRRYRKGVRKTVEETTDEERAADARALTGEERDDALEAEEDGKSKARSPSSEREI
jgi:hypothetical protein